MRKIDEQPSLEGKILKGKEKAKNEMTKMERKWSRYILKTLKTNP